MKQAVKKTLKIITLTFGLVVLILAAFSIWLYTGQLTAAKLSFIENLPYPVALVGTSPVMSKELALRLTAAEKSGENYNSNYENAIYNQLIKEKEIAQLARDKNISVSNEQVDAEYSDRKISQDQLNAYGLSPQDYKIQVIKPQLFALGLQIWFNSQRDLNSGAYAQADSLVSRISQGQNMGLLAQEFSQDEAGKASQGDLGFIDPVTLLPEMREAVINLKPGQAQIIPSRLGLHILMQEGQNSNKIHLRQIFLQTGDFNQWLLGQTQNFKVWQLVKI